MILRSRWERREPRQSPRKGHPADRDDQFKADAGGKLNDITTMTVFITDARYGDEFIKIRKEFFSGDYPCSALITVAGLARPEMLVEIQAIAVLDD